ncbi:MAG TPA: LacI family DNA-binding transcriptional regulator [Phycisphaerae bacterium]|nr:LacI family DNA-binding transcriptional regulator [Phycisphaerae bacterium]
MALGPTIVDVARTAGVSHMTVSRVFSGGGPVSEATRQKVLAAAESLAYRPNALASGLRGGRTRSVAIVWPFVDPWTGDTEIGLWVMQRLQTQGLVTYQAQHWPAASRMCSVLDNLIHRRVDGLVLFATPEQLGHNSIRRRLQRICAVTAVTYAPVDDFPGDQVIHDRNGAVVEVVDHLAAIGRKRPALMISLEVRSNHSKREAFLEACRRRNIEEHPHSLIEMPPPLVTVEDPFSSDADRYQQTLENHFPPGRPVDVDAIFTFNDTGAMVTSRWLEQRGLRVPDDVAVIGFNDTDAAALWNPPLASGDRRRKEVAHLVEQFVMERLSRPELPLRQQTLSMRFIWRASAGGRGNGLR